MRTNLQPSLPQQAKRLLATIKKTRNCTTTPSTLCAENDSWITSDTGQSNAFMDFFKSVFLVLEWFLILEERVEALLDDKKNVDMVYLDFAKEFYSLNDRWLTNNNNNNNGEMLVQNYCQFSPLCSHLISFRMTLSWMSTEMIGIIFLARSQMNACFTLHTWNTFFLSCSLYHKGCTKNLGCLQRLAKCILFRFKWLIYDHRLQRLFAPSLKLRRHQVDLPAAFASSTGRPDLFIEEPSTAGLCTTRSKLHTKKSLSCLLVHVRRKPLQFSGWNLKKLRPPYTPLKKQAD